MLRVRHIALGAVFTLATNLAMAFEPMTATIRVSNGALYDYVVIGENPAATDGYDNAFDIIAPGNLSASMGEPFISAVVEHPDWKPAFRDLRGDVRSLSQRQEWQMVITSSLPKGVPLSISLQSDRSSVPGKVKVLLSEGEKKIDLRERYLTPAPGPGAKATLLLTVDQP